MNQVQGQSAQERMIRQQVIDRGIRDERVIQALRDIPREQFFPDDYRSDAFADRPSPIGHGQTISQPYIAALMSQRLDVRPNSRVLEIGTGSGYQTAILGRLAGEVWSIERVKPLLDDAFERLMKLGIRNVHLRHGDGTLGWPEAAPFDRILIGAGAPRLPQALLLDQLIDGGIAILPVGSEDEQVLLEARREGARIKQTEICACRFVRLIGREGWGSNVEVS